MRAHPSPVRAAATLLAVAAAVFLWAPRAAALETLITTDQNFQSHHATHLPAPGGLTEPLRLNEFPVGPCIAHLDASRVATCLTLPDPFSLISGSLTLKTDGTLHIVAGQLSVNGTGGLIADAPLTFSGIHLQLTVDGTSLNLSGSTLQRKALTGAVTAADGSGTTAFGVAGAHAVLGVAGGSTAVPAFIGPAATGDFFGNFAGSLGWGAVPWGSVSGAPTPDGVTLGLTGSTYQRLALTGAVTSSAGSAATAFGVQSGLSLFGVAGSSTTIPAPIIASVANTFAGYDGTGIGYFPVTPSTAGTIATWPVANPRYFAVSTTGSDSNACFSDVSQAAAGAVPCATLAGLLAKIPRNGAGRLARVAIKAGNYATDTTLDLSGFTGYSQLSFLATDTIASAGATAFTGDTADTIGAGMTTCAGMNAGGYNATAYSVAGDGTATITLQIAGGGAPGFSAQPARPYGCRLRADHATTTTALRNYASGVLFESGGNALIISDGLPATPVTGSSGDIFYLEQPAVTGPTATIIASSGSNGVVGSNVLSPGMSIAGIQFGVLTVAGSTVGLSGDEATNVFVANSTFSVSQGISNVPFAAAQLGAGLRATRFVGFSGGAAHITDLATTSTLAMNVFTNPESFLLERSAMGGGLVVYSGGRASGNNITESIGTNSSTAHWAACQFWGIPSSPPQAVLTTALALDGGANIGRINFTGIGANPAIRINGTGLAVNLQLPTGTTSDVGVDLSPFGVSGNTVGCMGCTISVTSTGTPLVTGSNGDIRLADGTIVTWAQFQSGVVDAQSNRSIGTGSTSPITILPATGTTLSGGALTVPGLVGPGHTQVTSGGLFSVDTTTYIPATRTVQGTTPILIAGGTSAVDLSANRVWSLATNGVTDSLFRQSGPLSLVGRSANSTGNTADISATAASDCAYRESGSTLGCGTLATAAYSNNSVTLGKLQQIGAGTFLGNSGGTTSNVATNTFLPPFTFTTGNLGILRDNTTIVVNGSNQLAVGAVPESSVTNLTTDLAGKQATGNYVTAGTGPVTFSGPGSAATAINLAGGSISNTLPSANIGAASVAYSKIQNESTSTLLGNPTGSITSPSEITLGTGLSFSGSVLNAAGTTYTATSPIVVTGSVISCPTCGTSSATGTVTTVTGTSPIVVTSTPTTTPNVTIQGALLDGTTGTGGQNLGALSNGTLQQTVSAGHSTISAFNGTTSLVPFYTTSGQLTQDSTFAFDGTGHTLTMGGSTPISLNAAGTQIIDKSIGNLVIRTSGASALSLGTSGTSRLVISSAGDVTIPTLGTGMVKSTSGLLGNAAAGIDYQAPGNYITDLTGDGTASGPGSAAFTLAASGVTANTYGGPGRYIQSVEVDAKGRVVSNPVVISGVQAVVWKFFSRGEFLNYDSTNKSDAFAMADGDSVRWAGSGVSIAAMAVLNSSTTNSAPYYTNNVTPDSNGTLQAYLGYANGVGSGAASLKVDLFAIHGSPGNSSNYTDLATCTISPTQAAGDNIGSCSASIGTSFSVGDLFIVVVSRGDTNGSLSLNNISLAATVWIPQ